MYSLDFKFARFIPFSKQTIIGKFKINVKNRQSCYVTNFNKNWY